LLGRPRYALLLTHLPWAEAVVVEQEEGHDHASAPRSLPVGEGIFRCDRACRARHLDHELVFRLAGEAGSAFLDRPEFMIAGRPDHLGKTLLQEFENFPGLHSPLPDTTRAGQPDGGMLLKV